MGLSALYAQFTYHRDGTQIVLTEDQIDRMAQNQGVELAPTDRMIDFAENLLARRPELDPLLPEDWNKNFDVLREFLDTYSEVELGGRKDREGFDCRLEKVKTLLTSIRKNEKLNVLDFEIVDEKEKESSAGESEGPEQGNFWGRSQPNREDGRRDPAAGAGKRTGIRVGTEKDGNGVLKGIVIRISLLLPITTLNIFRYYPTS